MTHARGGAHPRGKDVAARVERLQSGRREGDALARAMPHADRVQAGEIRLEDARAAANEPASLTAYLGR